VAQISPINSNLEKKNKDVFSSYPFITLKRSKNNSSSPWCLWDRLRKKIQHAIKRKKD